MAEERAPTLEVGVPLIKEEKPKDEWIDIMVDFISLGEPQKKEQYRQRLMKRKEEYAPVFEKLRGLFRRFTEEIEKPRRYVEEKKVQEVI